MLEKLCSGLYLSGGQQRGLMLMVCNSYLPRDIFLPHRLTSPSQVSSEGSVVTSPPGSWVCRWSPLSLSEKSFPKLTLPRLVHAVVFCALDVVLVVQLSFISPCFYAIVLSFQQILGILLLGLFICQKLGINQLKYNVQL